jgi:Lon protease-like protein
MNPGQFPVFPLRTLCFPGHKVSLRIFEERYVQMLGDLEADPRFVISLISHGEEVGGEATPYRVGTLVEVGDVQRQGDFHLIKPEGIRRVYMETFDRSHPYLTARCVDYTDEPGETAEPPALRELESRILGMATEMTQEESRGIRELLEDVKSDLDRENYSLFLCGCLHLPPIYLQRLLETRSLSNRLQNALSLLSQSQ